MLCDYTNKLVTKSEMQQIHSSLQVWTTSTFTKHVFCYESFSSRYALVHTIANHSYDNLIIGCLILNTGISIVCVKYGESAKVVNDDLAYKQHTGVEVVYFITPLVSTGTVLLYCQ